MRKQRAWRSNTSRPGDVWRAYVSLLLCALFLQGMVPPVLAASPTTAQAAGAAVTPAAQSVQPTPVASPSQSMAPVGRPTYLFETTTGNSTGTEDKIQLLLIHYTDVKGQAHSKFLFPYEDSLRRSYQEAAAANDWQSKEDARIEAKYGYTLSDLTARQAMRPFKTDQYLFHPTEAIRTVDQIQIFASGSGSWNCQAMRVFRVDSLGGLYRNNPASPDGYIDFKGTMISEVTFTGTGTRTIGWESDKLINIGGTDSLASVTLETPTDADYAAHEPQGKYYQAGYYQPDRTIAVRFDFADVFGAGLETLSTLPGDSAKTLESLGQYECLALTLRYTDRYGSVIETQVPAVINAVEWAVDHGVAAASEITGMAQQGEALVTAAFLPEYQSFYTAGDVVATVGMDSAETALKLTRAGGDAGQRSAHAALDRTVQAAGDNASTAAFMLNTLVYELKKTAFTVAIDNGSLTPRWTCDGSPMAYRVAESTAGEPLQMSSANRITLRSYTASGTTKPTLVPRDREDKYLISITTDSIPGLGAQGDIYVKVNFNDLEGNARSTNELKIRDYARDFYGYWPGNQESSGYYGGTAAGQTVKAIVSIQNIKTITGVQVRYDPVSEDDEWQMIDLTIDAVNSAGDSAKAISRRNAQWASYSVNGYTSDRSFDRTVSATKIFAYSDNYKGVPQFFQDGETKDISGTISKDVETVQKVDWTEIQYSMNYDEASQDLGFAKERYLYKVTVDVAADDAESGENGDSGSKALFYFRLAFQSGKTSGFVLANQQLHSDGFRTDTQEEFFISTNQDYGDVVAVEVIPDYFSAQTDVFDKLHVNSIQVSKETNASVSPTWTVSSVGWIGIEYRDDTSQPIGGVKGRSAEELIHSYVVDSSSYDINLMVAITTGDYERPNQQFRGSISATVYYKHTTPSTAPANIPDVVKSMYDYIGHTPVYSDAMGGKAVSDPNWMFRAGHTDRFFLSLKDVESITRIEFMVRSETNVKWNIDHISIFQVHGEGSLVRNRNNEYERIYKEGEKLGWLTEQNVETVPAYSTQLHMYQSSTATGESDVTPIYVNFVENKIELSPDAAQWKAIIAKEPAGENDTLNVFLYPSVGDAYTAVSEYDLSTTIQYTDHQTVPRQTATGVMRRVLYKERPMFFTTGITAQGLVSLNSAIVTSGNSGSAIRGGIDRAIIEQVRSGVVIRTWDMTGSIGDTEWGLDLIQRETSERERQRVLIQLGENTTDAVLTASKKDLAVALWYRSDDPSGQEHRSPYIYLTDQGYSEIHPGQLLELTFPQTNIDAVTGISIASIGELTATVSGAYVADRVMNIATGEVSSLKAEYSFAGPLTVANVPYRMNPAGNLRPLELTFVTGAASESERGGTEGPVRMVLGYYDRYGDMRTATVEDLRQYLTDSERTFTTGSTRTARMLVNDLAQIRWIQLEPWHDKGSEAASWTLAGVSAQADGVQADRAVNATLRENEPQQITLANLSLQLTARMVRDGETTVVTTQAGEARLLTASKGTVTVVPQVTGSNYGWSAEADLVVDNFPASADSTISVNGGVITFTAPENKSGVTEEYWITVTLEEAPTVKAVVKIGVRSDAAAVAPQTSGGSVSGGSSAGGDTSAAGTGGTTNNTDTASRETPAAESAAPANQTSGETESAAGKDTQTESGAAQGETPAQTPEAQTDSAEADQGETGSAENSSSETDTTESDIGSQGDDGSETTA